MTPVENLFLWIGSNFDRSIYLSTSKIQAVCWSVADIALVLAVLKIADLARRRFALGRVMPLYLLLLGTAVITPLLVLAQTPWQFFVLECVICGCQFLILLYVALTERNRVLELFLSHKPSGTPPQDPGPIRSPETP